MMSTAKSLTLLAMSAGVAVADTVIQNSSFYSCSANSFELVQNHSAGIWPYRSYVSSDQKPPELLINKTSQKLQPGLIFFGQENSGTQIAIGELAAFIMTDSGDLVYGIRGETSNFHTQMLHNESVLTSRSGLGAAAVDAQVGFGYGQINIWDSSYNLLYTVCPNVTIGISPKYQNVTCFADVHESLITDDNTMLITVYNTTQADLSGIGGPEDGWVVDPLVVEVDPTTNETLFVWSPLQHVSLNASHSPRGGNGMNISRPYDYFHTNAIQKYKGGYLVNSRHCWTTYFVDKNGTIQWQINGKDGGDLGNLPDGANFSWQHDARIATDPNNPNRSIIRYFANNNFLPNTTTPSTGLYISFDYPPTPRSNARLEHVLHDPNNPIAVYAEGANNPLKNGNYFMGYGAVPYMREYASNGTLLWSAQFGFDRSVNSSHTYRAFKQEWYGQPQAWGPSLVVKTADEHDALSHCADMSAKRGHVSWNGATDITAWNVYSSNASDTLELMYTVAKEGFETAFVVPMDAKYVRVGAVERGVEVRMSNSVNVKG